MEEPEGLMVGCDTMLEWLLSGPFSIEIALIVNSWPRH